MTLSFSSEEAPQQDGNACAVQPACVGFEASASIFRCQCEGQLIFVPSRTSSTDAESIVSLEHVLSG
jgi:hypothetical protein